MALTILKKPSLLKPAASAPAIPQVAESYKPNLAAEGVLGEIVYPKVALVKHNGVRAENQKGQLLARSLKPIGNKFITKSLSIPELTNLGGELVVGNPLDEEVFSITTSAVRSSAGEPDFKWYTFDWFHPTMPFIERLAMRNSVVVRAGHPNVDIIEWQMVNSDEELTAYSDWALAQGFEGLVLRDPNGRYNQGRSTANPKDQGFMRYCPWLRSEAVILAIGERMENKNPTKINELGYQVRSSHKENMVGLGRAGFFKCRDIHSGIEFSMTVPTDKLQQHVWDHPDLYLGTIRKYKYKPAVIKGGAPRFPQDEGQRADFDMS